MGSRHLLVIAKIYRVRVALSPTPEATMLRDHLMGIAGSLFVLIVLAVIVVTS